MPVAADKARRGPPVPRLSEARRQRWIGRDDHDDQEERRSQDRDEEAVKIRVRCGYVMRRGLRDDVVTASVASSCAHNRFPS